MNDRWIQKQEIIPSWIPQQVPKERVTIIRLTSTSSRDLYERLDVWVPAVSSSGSGSPLQSFLPEESQDYCALAHSYHPACGHIEFYFTHKMDRPIKLL